MQNQLSKKIYKYVKTKVFQIKTKNSKIKIVWFPKISSANIFARELSRSIWYLFPIREQIDSIVFCVDDSLADTLLENFHFPDYVEPSILTLWADMQNLIQIQSSNLCDENRLHQYDLIIEWKKTLNVKKFFPYVIEADVDNNQFEANRILHIGNLIQQGSFKKNIAINYRRFIKLVEQYKSLKYDSILLIGSGPSLQELIKSPNDFSYTMTIVCNSIVKNDDIFDKYHPKIIVASDAVFHSGYSKYAAEFRNMVIQRMMDDHEVHFIVPFRDYFIYTAYFPDEIKNRIIGIPAQKSRRYNFDLLKQFFLKSTSNVLTFMMIPLGVTLGKKVFLAGFDGRAKQVIDTFWEYDQNSQFQDEYDSTKYAHPAFYKVNYEEYYQKHCDETSMMVGELSRKNISLQNLTDTSIPALKVLR